MTLRCPKPSPKILAAVAATLFFLSASSLRAQGVGSPPLLTDRETAMRNERDKLTRGPDIEQRARASRFPVRARALRMATAREIKKDAERMQFFNSEMMRSVSTGAPLDYDRIIKATGEIKKHARRLVSNLRLPRSEKAAASAEGQDNLNDKEIVASLAKLDEMVKGLSANSLLVNRNIVDVHQATDAGRNLEEIIALSEKIRKSAKRLRHAARQ